jgi:hypothetical protein
VVQSQTDMQNKLANAKSTKWCNCWIKSWVLFGWK